MVERLTEENRLHELAEFLRSRRARLTPEHVGLPPGRRRRTPGLRRQEVASLAGVSAEWYTRLEQGRNITISAQLAESLANALRLDTTERAHLFLLALRQSPPVQTFTPPAVSPALHHFLDQLPTSPACVVDARLNVLAHNAAYGVVFDDVTTLSAHGRNLMWRLFTAPKNAQGSPEWHAIARVYVAQFRVGYGRFVDDPWWAAQIEALSALSPAFKALWERHDITHVTEGQKTIHHPQVGTLAFDFLWLQTVGDEELRLLIHTPRSGTPTAASIARLLEMRGQKCE